MISPMAQQTHGPALATCSNEKIITIRFVFIGMKGKLAITVFH